MGSCISYWLKVTNKPILPNSVSKTWNLKWICSFLHVKGRKYSLQKLSSMVNKDAFAWYSRHYNYHIFFRQGSIGIFIMVLDLNDNYPQFVNLPYQANISEVRWPRLYSVIFSVKSHRTNYLLIAWLFLELLSFKAQVRSSGRIQHTDILTFLHFFLFSVHWMKTNWR